MCAFHGQMGMFTRALAYILSHGADGLRQVAEDAELLAWITHTQDVALVGAWPKNEALERINKATFAARLENFPLQFSAEPDE